MAYLDQSFPIGRYWINGKHGPLYSYGGKIKATFVALVLPTATKKSNFRI